MVARLGLGTGALGNLFERITEGEAQRVIRAALAAGVDFIDTAPHYGHGLAERRVGAALATWTGSVPLLSTKVGRVLRPLRERESLPSFGFVDADRFCPEPDYTADGVMRAFEGSCARLGRARFDMVHMHDLGRLTWGADERKHWRHALNGGFAALGRLKEEGRVGAIGLGVNETEIVDRALAAAPLDIVLLANRHTLLDHRAWRGGLFDRLAERNVRVMLGGVFNSGLLAAPDAANPRFEYRSAGPSMVAEARRLAAICARHDVPLGAAALAFAARTPGVERVLIGPRSVAELNTTLAWWTQPVPDALWVELGVAQPWREAA